MGCPAHCAGRPCLPHYAMILCKHLVGRLHSEARHHMVVRCSLVYCQLLSAVLQREYAHVLVEPLLINAMLAFYLPVMPRCCDPITKFRPCRSQNVISMARIHFYGTVRFSMIKVYALAVTFHYIGFVTEYHTGERIIVNGSGIAGCSIALDAFPMYYIHTLIRIVR